MSLQPSFRNTLAVNSETGEASLSIYSGELTGHTMTRSVAKIKATFPGLAPGFFDIFLERIKEKGFSDKRLIDAVNYVIDTCQYPTPTLANFLSFDKRIKIRTYHELCNMVTKGEDDFNRYTKIKIAGIFHYVRIADKEMFNIPDEL